MTSRSPIRFEAFDSSTISHLEEKRRLALAVAGQARSGQTIGAGSGSTAFLAVNAIADRIRSGELVDIALIPTSHEVRLTVAGLAATLPGLSVGDLAVGPPDWLFDGADEVDPDGNLIKGRGGALLREKIMFCATTDRRVLVDESKRVERLGEHFPVPVEVIREAFPVVGAPLADLGATEIAVRTGTGKDGPVLTESGNLLLDCRFDRITPDLEVEIKRITGVVESGLFQGYSPSVFAPET